MVDQMTLQTISIVIASISVTIGSIYYILTLRNTYRNRQATLFSSLQNRMDSLEFRRMYRTMKYELGNKPIEEIREIFQKNPDILDECASLVSFFNHMGWLVKSGLLSIDAVIGNSVDVMSFYEIVRPWLDDYEKVTGYDQSFPPLTYLYNEMKKRQSILDSEREKAQATRY